MTRGDQRERDRAKAQAKLAAKVKSTGRGGDPLTRNANDAAALQAKVAAKQAKQTDPSSAATSGGAAPAKAPNKATATNKKDSVDDLLMAGLQVSQKAKKLAA